MTYLVSDDIPSEPAGGRFRDLLANPGIVEVPRVVRAAGEES